MPCELYDSCGQLPEKRNGPLYNGPSACVASPRCGGNPHSRSASPNEDCTDVEQWKTCHYGCLLQSASVRCIIVWIRWPDLVPAKAQMLRSGNTGGARLDTPGYHEGQRKPGARRLEMAHRAAGLVRPTRKSVSMAEATIAQAMTVYGGLVSVKPTVRSAARSDSRFVAAERETADRAENLNS